MAGADITLKLDERVQLGKGLNQLRRSGVVPAVIHDHGKQSIHIMGSTIDFIKAYKEAGKNHPVNIVVGDKKFLALIKDVAYRPPKHEMQHIVFQAVAKDEKVEAEVPVTIVGTPPAERIGLLVLHQLDHVVVQATPDKLPDRFEVDAEKLAELGDRVAVSDLIVPEDVVIMTEPEHAIATVVEPRAIAAEEPEVEEGEAEEGEAGEEGTEAADTSPVDDKKE